MPMQVIHWLSHVNKYEKVHCTHVANKQKDAIRAPRMKVCIATPASIGISETFIQAVLDGLNTEVLHISGNGCSYSNKGVLISEIIDAESESWFSRGLNLMPRFVEFRIRRKLFPAASEAEKLARFLSSRSVNVVLAQYGTQAADLVPACRMAGVPLVPHFHGFDASRHSTIEDYSSRYADLFAYCDRIIAVSKRMQLDLIELGCEREKIVHIPYAPHPSFFDVIPNYESNQLVMVGRLTDQKAPHLSLLAFARVLDKHPELRLRIVGEGELRSVCRDLINALGIATKVDLLGAGDRAIIQREFSDAVLFLQHSIEAANGDREGTPVAVLEAGASGLPVISTLHAGIPDVVISGRTGILVGEGDVNSMADAICSIIRDRKLASNLGKSAREHVRTHFPMENHLDRIHAVLADAIGPCQYNSC